MRFAAFLVAGALVLAGCGSAGTAAKTPAVNPAPAPTATAADVQAGVAVAVTYSGSTATSVTTLTGQ